jgi:hypothetical protein
MALKRWLYTVGLQLFGLANSPVQQYLSDFAAKQALLHPTHQPVETQRLSQCITSNILNSTEVTDQ